MPFSNDSLYGWGVCQIPMPRATQDIFADRRTQNVAHDPDRRQQIILQPFSVIWSGMMRRDFPLGKTLLVAIFGLMSIILLSLVSLLIPKVMEEVVPEPVKIVARILDEPLPPPPVKMPLLQPPSVLAQEKPAPIQEAIPPVTREKEAVPLLEKKVVVLRPEESKPELKLREPRNVKQEKKVAEDPVLMPKKIVTLNSVKNKVDVEPQAPKNERTYDLLQQEAVPLAENTSRFVEKNREPRIAQNAGSLNRNYNSGPDKGRQGELPRGKTFASAAAGTSVDLPSVTQLKKTLGQPRSQGDGSVPETGQAFSPKSSGSEVKIGPAERMGGSYQIVSESGGPVRITREGVLKMSAMNGVDLPNLGKKAGRTVSDGQETAVDLQTGPVNFASDAGANPDPSLFVSVNQLGACISQSEDDRLSGKLASELEVNTQCRTGDMIFRILNPIDAYNVRVSVYNPIRFADKCAALSAAIECIQHLK